MAKIIGMERKNDFSEGLKKGIDAAARGASASECIKEAGIDIEKLKDDMFENFMNACDAMVTDILRRHPSLVTASQAEKDFMVTYHDLGELADIEHIIDLLDTTEKGGR